MGRAYSEREVASRQRGLRLVELDQMVPATAPKYWREYTPVRGPVPGFSRSPGPGFSGTGNQFRLLDLDFINLEVEFSRRAGTREPHIADIRTVGLEVRERK